MRLSGSLPTVPRVILRDTELLADDDPLVQPNSPEMPALADRPARLQLFGEIARGGMGAILRGRDVDLGRELAVKVLLESNQGHPEVVRRFIEEAQIGGQLQHPGIVPVYELGAFADRRRGVLPAHASASRSTGTAGGETSAVWPAHRRAP